MPVVPLSALHSGSVGKPVRTRGSIQNDCGGSMGPL